MLVVLYGHTKFCMVIPSFVWSYQVLIEILKLNKSCYNIFGIFYDEYIVKCITIIIIKFRLYPSGTVPSNLPCTELIQKKQSEHLSHTSEKVNRHTSGQTVAQVGGQAVRRAIKFISNQTFSLYCRGWYVGKAGSKVLRDDPSNGNIHGVDMRVCVCVCVHIWITYVSKYIMHYVCKYMYTLRMYVSMYVCIYVCITYVCMYYDCIQGVTGGTDQTSGECSLC